MKRATMEQTSAARDPANGRGRRAKKTDQDAPGAIFSRGWLRWYPPFSSASAVNGVVHVSMELQMFARLKTIWTLPPLWTHSTRPQGFGNLAQHARFPQRPHRSSFLSSKKKNEEQGLRSTVHHIGSDPSAGRRRLTHITRSPEIPVQFTFGLILSIPCEVAPAALILAPK